MFKRCVQKRLTSCVELPLSESSTAPERNARCRRETFCADGRSKLDPRMFSTIRLRCLFSSEVWKESFECVESPASCATFSVSAPSMPVVGSVKPHGRVGFGRSWLSMKVENSRHFASSHVGYFLPTSDHRKHCQSY